MREYLGVWACVALFIQHATRINHNVFSFVAFLTSTYFSTLSHIREDFRKKVIEHKVCVLIFSTTFIYNISYSKKNSARYFHTTEHHVKFSLFLQDFNEILIFSTEFQKTLKYQISSKSVH